MRNVDFSKGKTRIFQSSCRLWSYLPLLGDISVCSAIRMPDLTLASAPLDVMNGSQHAGNSTEMGFEEIINAEFLVSLRSSAHVPGFAVITRTLWLC